MDSIKNNNCFEDIYFFNIHNRDYTCDKLYIFLKENTENVKNLFNIDDKYFDGEVKPVIEVVATKPINEIFDRSDFTTYYNITILNYIVNDDNVKTADMPFPFNKRAEEIYRGCFDYGKTLCILEGFKDCENRWFKSNRTEIMKVKFAILKLLRPNTDDCITFNVIPEDLKTLELDKIFEQTDLVIRITKNGNVNKDKKYKFSIYDFDNGNISIDNSDRFMYPANLSLLFTKDLSYDTLIHTLLKIETEIPKSAFHTRTINFYTKNSACYYQSI